jgi:hypothetical protein
VTRLVLPIIGGVVIGTSVAYLWVAVHSRHILRTQRRHRQLRYINPRDIHRLSALQEQNDNELVRVLGSEGERSGQ